MIKHGLLKTRTDPAGAFLQAVLRQAESDYRQAAYEALLNRIGTSFEELRSARLADDQTRQALAERLGFEITSKPLPDPNPTLIAPIQLPLPSPTPQPQPETNPLLQFLLQPGKFTEADLEGLFGLVDTTRNPLRKPVSNPKLLELQLQFLKSSWLKQDAAAEFPIIDPDVIGAANLRSDSAAFTLWQYRNNWLNQQLAAIKAQREAQPASLAGFNLIVSDTLGPIADLVTLDTQRLAGADIQPQLEQKQLTVSAFVHLINLRSWLLNQFWTWNGMMSIQSWCRCKNFAVRRHGAKRNRLLKSRSVPMIFISPNQGKPRFPQSLPNGV